MPSYAQAGEILPGLRLNSDCRETARCFAAGTMPCSLPSRRFNQSGRHQLYLRDLRDYQRLRGPSRQFAEFQRSMPRRSQSLGHLLCAQHGRKSLGVVPFRFLPRDDRRPVLQRICPVGAFGLSPQRLRRPQRDRPAVYEPYLAGSRYALEQLKASFSGVTLETTREHLLLSLIRGNAVYQGTHLKEVSGMMTLGRRMMTTGNAAKIRASWTSRSAGRGTLSTSFKTSLPCWARQCSGRFI